MLGRDAVMWSDRIGLKGETNGSGDANSTAGATVFARAPMVRRMRQSAAAAERPTNARIEKPARPEEAASRARATYITRQPTFSARTNLYLLLNRWSMTEDKTILDTVGGTPLVRVDRVLPAEVKANGVRVLCKLEMQNPGESKRTFC